ncbi:hypothetical protein NJ7G_3427 [Natrinema sp. J7-2]|nr:hypothetical protein NJ7G_3427 [Natrinema sp. J7-2]
MFSSLEPLEATPETGSGLAPNRERIEGDGGSDAIEIAVARRARALIADCETVDGCPACVMDDQCGNDN